MRFAAKARVTQGQKPLLPVLVELLFDFPPQTQFQLTTPGHWFASEPSHALNSTAFVNYAKLSSPWRYTNEKSARLLVGHRDLWRDSDGNTVRGREDHSGLREEPMDLIGGLARWVHFLAGVMWIGLLYYFNFVQVP